MRPEGNNPLDLNNLPEDYATGGNKQLLSPEDNTSSSDGGCGGGSSSSTTRKKKDKNGGGDEQGKVYECRFCSLKFCKSQALGGHMNRHRQERETETLNKARQLVFTNDLAPGHLAYNVSSNGQPHMNVVDPPYRAMYSSSGRVFSGQPPPPPAAPYNMYPSPPPSRLLSFHSQFPPPPPNNNDYFLGHVLSEGNNYTCIGAPVGNAGPTTTTQEEWNR